MSILLKTTIGIAAVLAAIFLVLNLLRIWMIRKAGKLKGKNLKELYPAAKLKTGFIYFFSPSCAPCRQMTPMLRKIEKEGVPGRFVDISVDMAPARSLGVFGTPAVVLVKEDIVSDVIFGMQSESMLRERLSRLNIRGR
ncbi:MAG: thioredoxin family protein [Acidobacteria bacterium]|nr:thioredoxin family protein [Acidobacteriota bacterium]